jgi:hypothetical protein
VGVDDAVYAIVITTVMSLEGVTVLIVSYASALNDKAALTLKLESLGARVAARFSKEVSHVVFRRRPQASPAEREEEDCDLRSLYQRAAKVALCTKVTLPSSYSSSCALMGLCLAVWRRASSVRAASLGGGLHQPAAEGPGKVSSMC